MRDMAFSLRETYEDAKSSSRHMNYNEWVV